MMRVDMKTIMVVAGLTWLTPLAMAAGHHDEHNNHATATHAASSHQGAYFVSPLNKATVSTTVQVEMGVHGMKVHKAGKLIEGTGHHHLIIDGGFIEQGKAVPKDAQHIHFGKGQTSTTIKLSPGKHTLTLQFADGYHRSYGKGASQNIEVMVKD